MGGRFISGNPGWDLMQTRDSVAEPAHVDLRSQLYGCATVSKPFLADSHKLRLRVKRHLGEAPVTSGIHADRETLFKLLDDLLTTELLCVLRCKRYRYMTSGAKLRSLADQFVERAGQEQMHVDQIAERIFLMGGEPNFTPAGLASRNQAAYLAGESFIDLIKEDLLAACIAMDSYREIINYLGTREPVTCRILEEILAEESKHAVQLAELLETLPA